MTEEEAWEEEHWSNRRQKHAQHSWDWCASMPMVQSLVARGIPLEALRSLHDLGHTRGYFYAQDEAWAKKEREEQRAVAASRLTAT